MKTFEHARWLENIRFEMEVCVDEKTFYEKLESLKPGESKVIVYIDDSFYENAKNYLQTLPKFQQGKEHESHAELSKRDISTIKRKGWTLKGEEIVTANNKVVVPKSKPVSYTHLTLPTKRIV